MANRAIECSVRARYCTASGKTAGGMTMGWLGPDNFDNDRGLDYLNEVAGPVSETVERMAEYPDLGDPEEPHSDQSIAAVEILAILCEHTPYVPPATAVVEKARDGFVAYWYQAMQNWIHSNDTAKPNPDYVEKRHAVMLQTFERLLVQCRQADADGLVRD
jgi:hypothetical protein